MRIAGDADDFHRDAYVPILRHDERLAYRILRRPVAPGRGLRDDDRVRGTREIGRREITAAHDRDPNEWQVAWRDRVEVDLVPWLAAWQPEHRLGSSWAQGDS